MKQNQKLCTKLKKVIDRGKRSMTLSEVKQVKNINKNLKSFLEISPVQKMFVLILLLPMNSLISFEIYSTSKLSKCVTLSAFTYKAIQ